MLLVQLTTVFFFPVITCKGIPSPVNSYLFYCLLTVHQLFLIEHSFTVLFHSIFLFSSFVLFLSSARILCLTSRPAANQYYLFFFFSVEAVHLLEYFNLFLIPSQFSGLWYVAVIIISLVAGKNGKLRKRRKRLRVKLPIAKGPIYCMKWNSFISVCFYTNYFFFPESCVRQVNTTSVCECMDGLIIKRVWLFEFTV